MASEDNDETPPFTPEQLVWIDRMVDARAAALSRASTDQPGGGAGSSSDAAGTSLSTGGLATGGADAPATGPGATLAGEPDFNIRACLVIGGSGQALEMHHSWLGIAYGLPAGGLL